jgi:hypothetical protein
VKVQRVMYKNRTKHITCEMVTNLGIGLNKPCLKTANFKLGDVFMCHTHAAYVLLETSVKGTEVLYI